MVRSPGKWSDLPQMGECRSASYLYGEIRITPAQTGTVLVPNLLLIDISWFLNKKICQLKGQSVFYGTWETLANRWRYRHAFSKMLRVVELSLSNVKSSWENSDQLALMYGTIRINTAGSADINLRNLYCCALINSSVVLERKNIRLPYL